MIGLALVAAVASFSASEAPVYGPAPDWVEPVAVDLSGPVGSRRTVLHDSQFRLHPDGWEEAYVEHADVVPNTESLAGLGTIRIAWNPSHGRLTVHRVLIHRGGKTIDALAGGRTFTVLRREEQLERAMLNGRLTATLQVEGLQVGDVLERAYTITQHDPTLGAHVGAGDNLNHAGGAVKERDRLLWRSDRSVAWKASTAVQPRVVKRADGWTELRFEAADTNAPDLPSMAPVRYALGEQIQASDYAGWADVAAQIGPLFRDAAQLSPDSPLRAEARAIVAASADPAARAAAALSLVEDKVRYFAMLVGDGGYRPQTADETWARRFGDCKAKTVLLLALLKELGISAQPALVRTSGGDAVPEFLPRPGVFDHVLVRAEIGGRTYWMDGTRTGDRGPLLRGAPRYRWALPLWNAKAELEAMKPEPLSAPDLIYLTRIDYSAGAEQPAPVEFDMMMRGDSAQAFRSLVARMGPELARKGLLASLSTRLKWVEAPEARLEEGPGRSFRVRLVGRARGLWSFDEDLERSRLTWPDHQLTVAGLPPRQGALKDVPYTQAFPSYVSELIELKLPAGGAGYEVRGPDGCVADAYRRVCATRTVAGGVARFTRTSQTLAPELPAEAARIDLPRMAALLDRKAGVLAPKATAAAGGPAGSAAKAGLP